MFPNICRVSRISVSRRSLILCLLEIICWQMEVHKTILKRSIDPWWGMLIFHVPFSFSLDSKCRNAFWSVYCDNLCGKRNLFVFELVGILFRCYLVSAQVTNAFFNLFPAFKTNVLKCRSASSKCWMLLFALCSWSKIFCVVYIIYST